MSDPRVPATGPDQAALAAEQARKERERLAEQERLKAAEAAKLAADNGTKPNYTDKAGVLDRDTVAKNDADLMAGYDKYAQADGSIKEDDFEKLYAEVHGGVPAATTAGAPGTAGAAPGATGSVPPVDPKGLTGPQQAEVDKAYAAAKKANDKVAADQEELDQELARVGGALTPEQQETFKQRFWADGTPPRDKARTDFKEAQAALAAKLKQYQGQLAGQYINPPPPPVADPLSAPVPGPDPRDEIENMLALAGDPHLAMDFAETVNASPEGKAAGLADRVAENIVSPNIAAVQAELVDQFDGNVQLAVDAMKNRLNGIFGDYKTQKSPAGKELTYVPSLLKSYADLAAIFAGPSKDVYKGLAAWAGAYKTSHLGTRLAAVGVVLGGLRAVSAAEQRQWDDALKELTSSAKGATDLLNVYREFVTKAKPAGFVGKKLAPILGGISASVATYQDLYKYSNSGDKALLGKAAGDAMVATGSFMALAAEFGTVAALATPVGQIGVALAATGAIVAYAFDQVYKSHQQNDRNKRAEKYLAGLIEPPQYAHLIAYNDAGHMAQLTNDMHLTPAQLADLYRQGYGNALLDSHQTEARNNVRSFAAVSAATSGEPPDYYAMMSGITRDYPQNNKDREEAVGNAAGTAAAVINSNHVTRANPQPASWWFEHFDGLAHGRNGAETEPWAKQGALYMREAFRIPVATPT